MYVATSQASSEVLRLSRSRSPVKLTHSGYASFAAALPLSASQPNVPTVPRFPPPAEHPEDLAEAFENLLHQFAAQYASQRSAMLRRIEKMCAASLETSSRHLKTCCVN